MRWCGTRQLWRAALGAAALLLLGQPAAAFYWYGWPGAGITPPPTITTRRTDTVTTTESTPPTTTVDYPEPGTDNPGPGGGTKATPEPATLLAAGIGLATVGLVRRWRRRGAA